MIGCVELPQEPCFKGQTSCAITQSVVQRVPEAACLAHHVKKVISGYIKLCIPLVFGVGRNLFIRTVTIIIMRKKENIFKIVLNAVALAMGVTTVVMSLMSGSEVTGVLLGLGLACLGLDGLNEL